MIFKFAHKIFCAKDLWKKTCTTTWKRYFFSKCITTHSDSDHAVLDLQFQRALGSCQKGLLHYVTLATKLLHVVLFHEDNTQLDPALPRTLLKVGVGLGHMYTKGWIFLDLAVCNIIMEKDNVQQFHSQRWPNTTAPFCSVWSKLKLMLRTRAEH